MLLLKIDHSLVIVSVSTSICVRASIVDAVQYGYRTIVLADCVSDMDLEAHHSNLCNIQRKYGEVLNSEQLLEIISVLDA